MTPLQLVGANTTRRTAALAAIDAKRRRDEQTAIDLGVQSPADPTRDRGEHALHILGLAAQLPGITDPAPILIAIAAQAVAWLEGETT